VTGSIRIERLIVARGGKDVIRGVDLEIPPGRITALLGANGAGKSSLVLAIAGGLPPASGAIFVGEKPIAGMRPEAVRRLGVAAVPEGHHVLGDLTVIDNLRVAGHHLTGARREAGVEAALETFPELREKLRARAGSLSGGQQQMVVLAQAIVDRPRFILADELSFGLAPVVVARLVPIIARLAAEGVGVLLIEQFTHIALKIADHVCVMERGHIRFRGGPEELRANPDILHSAYLAGDA
jgi:branched-chain amino acid transport system ATP-binding protein